MRIKDKLFGVLVIVSILAIICGIVWLAIYGIGEAANSEPEIPKSSSEEINLLPDTIGGYEFGEYEKYGSKDKEKRLEGDKIYVYGTCTDIETEDDVKICYIENDDEEWIIALWDTKMYEDVDFDFLMDEEIYVFGTYSYYSKQEDRPVMIFETIICDEETYDLERFINGSSEQAVEESTPEPVLEATPEPTQEPGKFNEETVISQLEVTEYQYTSSIDTPWVFLVVKNNSEFNLDATIDLKTYDSEGNIIGAKSTSQNAFENNTETIFTFMLDEEPASIEYEISVQEEDWYECVVSDLTYETTSAKNKEIVSVTNNGDEASEFVECTALFFEGDKVVYYATRYFTDADSEIKPGKTITEELKSYNNYDSFKLYFTGRR